MDQIMSRPWMTCFEDAFCEFDRGRLTERIRSAKAAINDRLGDLRNHTGHHEERSLMTHALHALTLLRLSTSRGGVDERGGNERGS